MRTVFYYKRNWKSVVARSRIWGSDLQCEEEGMIHPQATRKKVHMSNNDILPGFDEDTCDSLSIELENVEGVAYSLVLKPIGQIDTYSSLFFQRSSKKAIDAGFINLIFLLNGVDYVSSMGVGAFVQLQKVAREKGGDIALVDVHPKVMEIFKLMCLEKFSAALIPWTKPLPQ